MYGHEPVRAAVVMRDAAARRASRSKEGKREAERITKPSRSRADLVAVYGSDAAHVMLAMSRERDVLLVVREGGIKSLSYATFVPVRLRLKT